MEYEMKTPVALFIFLRDKTVLDIIDVLRRCRAKKIYLIGEGPRKDRPGEAEKVAVIREKVEHAIDWDCEVVKDYAPEDIGAGNRISTGVSFVLDREESAVFIEDDILPSKDFFAFCDEMLERYRNDTRVMAVSGCNMIQHYETEFSYFFCQIPFPWGWATWKRAWSGYDYRIRTWKEEKRKKSLLPMFPDREIYRQKANEWDLAYKGIDFTWDYQFAYHIMTNSGLVIVPKDNLIKYQGFDAVATNSSKNKFENVPMPLELPIKHPDTVMKSYDFEEKYYDTWLYNHRRFKKKCELLIKRILMKVLRKGTSQ